WVVDGGAFADASRFIVLICLLIALAESEFLLEFRSQTAKRETAQFAFDHLLALAAVLDELTCDRLAECAAHLGRALISGPGDVALADAQHDLAQGQGEMRI